MFVPSLIKTLALAGLVAPALSASATPLASLPQDAAAATLEQRFAAWKLRAAIGVPGPAALQEIESLVAAAAANEASAGSPQLLASMTASASSLRARLQPASEGDVATQTSPVRASSAAEKEVLRLALEKAIAENNAGFIVALGQRAVPVLKDMAASWDGSPPTGEQQSALHWLGKVSRHDALDVAVELMRSKSFLIKRGTLRVISTAKHFYLRVAWKPEGESDWRLVNPEWEQILHLALEEPAVEPSALKDVFEGFLSYGQLPRSMGKMAVEIGVNPRLLDVIPSEGRWYFEAMSRATDERLRSSGASRLPWLGNSELVIELAKDPSVKVRRELARSLLVGNESRWIDREQMIHESNPVKLNVDAATLTAFELLAQDSAADVRSRIGQAVSGYLKHLEDAPFTGEQLAYLLPRITDPNINKSLATTIQRLPEAERLPAVAAMVRSFGARGAYLDDYFNLDPKAYGLSRKDDFFALLDIWHAAGFFDQPEGTKNPRNEQLPSALSNLANSDGLNPDPFVERATAWGWLGFLAPKSSRSTKSLYRWAEALSDEASAELVRAIFSMPESAEREDLIERVDESLRLGLVESADVLRQLTENESAHEDARLWAARCMAQTQGHSIDDGLLSTMAQLVATSRSVSEANGVLRGLEGDQRMAFIRLLAAQPDATPEQFLGLRIGRLDELTLEALWPRIANVSWSEIPVSISAAQSLISALASLSSERLDPRLEAFNLSNPYVRLGLFRAAHATKNPLLLPLVREATLNPKFVVTSFWQEASEALGVYLSDEAAGILLEAAKAAPTPEARAHAMAALEEITKLREAAAAWEKSSGATAKRSQAIAELVVLLDDTQQPVESRAAALRGLGLLGAVEELPRIVRALASNEKAIQEAARAAMARLEKGE